jgi:hypothetical protein
MHPREAITHAGFVFTAFVVAGLAYLSACNTEPLSTLGYSSSSSSSATASAAGIWTGIDSATGLQMTGFIDSSGQADFILSNGIQFTGAVQVAGTSVAMSLDGSPQFGAQFSDGSTYGVGTFNGTVSSGSSITGTLTFTTTGNSMTTSNWSLTFSSLYDTSSPLSAVSGTYADNGSAVSQGLDPLSGASVSISSTGTLSGQNATNGCVLNGTISNSNTSYDVYQASYTYENCTGAYSVLDGVQFTGLADYNPNESPSEIVIAVTGENGSGTHYGAVLALSRT